MNDEIGIADIFSVKYNTLYNSVPFHNDDILCIRSTIDHRWQNTGCSGYGVMVADVHLKSGKVNGSEGLYSDNSIKGTKRLYVF